MLVFLRHRNNYKVKTLVINIHRECTIKLFTAVIIFVGLQARVFANLSPFNPSLILSGKVWCLPLQ